MKDYFSFQHDYFKLTDWCFTTIRGKSAIKQYKYDQEIKIIHCDESISNGSGVVLCRAHIIGAEIKKIGEISLDVLQRDADFLGFEIKNHWDFVGLINSMRKYSKIKSLDDEVCVFQLVKIESVKG